MSRRLSLTFFFLCVLSPLACQNLLDLPSGDLFEYRQIRTNFGWDSDTVMYGSATVASSVASTYCMLYGRLVRTEGAFRERMAALPEDCWPARTLVFTQTSDIGVVPVSISKNGVIRVELASQDRKVASGVQRFSVSLDGITLLTPQYPKEQLYPLQLPSLWKSPTSGIVSTSLDNGMCLVEGSVAMTVGEDAGASLPMSIATLPNTCRPPRRISFSAWNAGSSGRVDIMPDGGILWVDGENPLGTLSLSGVVFPSHQPTGMVTPGPQWVKDGSAFSLPAVYKSGRFCAAEGFLRYQPPNDTTSNPVPEKLLVMTLPESCRPTARRTLTILSNRGQESIDVDPHGGVYLANTGVVPDWVDLERVTLITGCKRPTRCLHNGFLRGDECFCRCQAPWIGEKCEMCGIGSKDCKNGGVFDETACLCGCPEGYSGTFCDCRKGSCPDGLVFDGEACGCRANSTTIPKITISIGKNVTDQTKHAHAAPVATDLTEGASHNFANMRVTVCSTNTEEMGIPLPLDEQKMQCSPWNSLGSSRTRLKEDVADDSFTQTRHVMNAFNVTDTKVWKKGDVFACFREVYTPQINHESKPSIQFVLVHCTSTMARTSLLDVLKALNTSSRIGASAQTRAKPYPHWVNGIFTVSATESSHQNSESIAFDDMDADRVSRRIFHRPMLLSKI